MLRTAAMLVAVAVCALGLGCGETKTDKNKAQLASSPAREQPSAKPAPAGTVDEPKSKPEWLRLADAWEEPEPIPNFELVDHNGRKFRLKELADSYVVVGFVFSTCGVPKACPLTMQRMRRVQRLWSARQQAGTTGGRRLRLLSLTLDPDTDTPAVFKRFGEAYDADLSTWTMATGPKGLMEDALPSLFGVLAINRGKGQVAHNVKLALLAPGLRAIAQWEDNKVEPARLIQLVVTHKTK